jgi:hypothetical protein
MQAPPTAKISSPFSCTFQPRAFRVPARLPGNVSVLFAFLRAVSIREAPLARYIALLEPARLSEDARPRRFAAKRRNRIDSIPTHSRSTRIPR